MLNTLWRYGWHCPWSRTSPYCGTPYPISYTMCGPYNVWRSHRSVPDPLHRMHYYHPSLYQIFLNRSPTMCPPLVHQSPPVWRSVFGLRALGLHVLYASLSTPRTIRRWRTCLHQLVPLCLCIFTIGFTLLKFYACLCWPSSLRPRIFVRLSLLAHRFHNKVN